MVARVKKKKIETQVSDSKVVVGKDTFDGYQLALKDEHMLRLLMWDFSPL